MQCEIYIGFIPSTISLIACNFSYYSEIDSNSLNVKENERIAQEAHYGASKNIGTYFQAIGRAGRDEK